MKSFLWLLTLFFATASLHSQVQGDYFFPEHLNYFRWPSTLVVGKWLYIDSGEIGWRDPSQGVTAGLFENTVTFAVDVSTSWNTTVVSQISSKKPKDMPLVRQADIWYDRTADMVYSLQGWPYVAVEQAVPTWWGFKPNDNGIVNWEPQPIPPNPQYYMLSTVVGGLSATSEKAHYILGGFEWYGNDYTSGLVLEEMYSYHSSNTSFHNLTLPNFNYFYGRAEYLPSYGKEGVILFFGGEEQPHRSFNIPTTSFRDLHKITVYDIHANKFYEQDALDAPIGRTNLCSVSSTAADNSSTEIFIYGGTTNTDQDTSTSEALRSVYILTVPAFKWIKTSSLAPWRFQHSCSLIGDRQMINVGGYSGDRTETNVYTDPWPNGFGIFDLTDLVWKDAYDATAKPYKRNTVVDSYYAQNPKYPSSWSNSDLKDIFERTAAVQPPRSDNATNSTNNASQTPSYGANTGAIAGGTFGGLAFLALGATLAWWLLKRHRSRKSAVEFAQSAIDESPVFTGPPKELDGRNGMLEMSTGANFHEADSQSQSTISALPIRHFASNHDYSSTPIVYEISGNEVQRDV